MRWCNAVQFEFELNYSCMFITVKNSQMLIYQCCGSKYKILCAVKWTGCQHETVISTHLFYPYRKSSIVKILQGRPTERNHYLVSFLGIARSFFSLAPAAEHIPREVVDCLRRNQSGGSSRITLNFWFITLYFLQHYHIMIFSQLDNYHKLDI